MWVGLRYNLVEKEPSLSKWYNMSFSLKSELDVMVDGVNAFHQPGLLVPP